MFKVGDSVFSKRFGEGFVTDVDDNDLYIYPIHVQWKNSSKHSIFTPEGHYTVSCNDPDVDICFLKPDYAITHKEEGDDEEMGQIAGVIANNIHNNIAPWGDYFKDRAEETVERMEDALNKKVEDAVNPAHYKVEGLPEAIDIINHLMHREQYEGFLWGNILKYAYRYGRKGDKAETAGKIAWYANQLKDLAEEKRGEEK